MSSTVTVAVAVVAFPAGSVTVSVTTFSPTSEHVKAVLLNAKVTPQMSEEPLSTAAAVVDPFPLASNCTVTS